MKMGWVAGGGDEENKDPFPVDTLVTEVLAELKEANGECKDNYSGQNWFCCSGMAECLVNLKNNMNGVLAQDLDDQNIKRACRKTKQAFTTAERCVMDVWCHKNTDREDILATFSDVLQEARAKTDKHCKGQTPDGTTTQKSSTPSTKPPTKSTTHNPQRTSSPTSSTTISTHKNATTQKPSSVTPSSAKHPVDPLSTTKKPNESTNITTISAVPSKPTPTKPSTPIHPSSTNPAVSTQPLSVSTDSLTSSSGPETKPPGTDNPSTADSTYAEKLNVTHVSGKTTDSNANGNHSSTPFLPGGHTTLSPNARNGTVTSHPENSDAIIVTVAVVGVVLLLLAFVIFAVCKWRQYVTELEGSNGSVTKRPFLGRFFHSTKTTATEDTDIYAEIDEAFMEAVYKVDQDKPSKKKHPSGTGSQVNICYEAGLEDNDAIIAAGKAARLRRMPRVSGDNPCDELPPQTPNDNTPHERPVVRGNIPRGEVVPHHPGVNEEVIAAFRSGGLSKRESKSYQLSQPAFTNMEYGDNTYEDIPQEGGEYVEINEPEPVYEVPFGNDSTYDSANYDVTHNRRKQQEPNYSHVHFSKSDKTDKKNKNTDYQESAFYENNDTMMEY